MKNALVIVAFLAAIAVAASAAKCSKTCVDVSPTCTFMKNYCSNPTIKSVCALSCGECEVCENKVGILVKPCEIGTCFDTMSPFLCSAYKKHKYGCIIVGTQCRATCGLCQKCSLPPTEPPCSKNCADKNPSCPYWKEGGFCDPVKGYADTRVVCPKSCGTCIPCPQYKLPPTAQELENQKNN